MGKVGSKGGAEGNRSVMMGTLLAGAFIALMAETFLNNALPTIMADFRVSQSTAQWLSTSYLLVVGLMIPVSAWVFSNFQSKHAFIVMMATFLTGSLVCTFSGGHFALLLTGRIIQAVAAGSLMPFIQKWSCCFSRQRNAVWPWVWWGWLWLWDLRWAPRFLGLFWSTGPGGLCSSCLPF